MVNTLLYVSHHGGHSADCSHYGEHSAVLWWTLCSHHGEHSADCSHDGEHSAVLWWTLCCIMVNTIALWWALCCIMVNTLQSVHIMVNTLLYYGEHSYLILIQVSARVTLVYKDTLTLTPQQPHKDNNSSTHKGRQFWRSHLALQHTATHCNTLQHTTTYEYAHRPTVLRYASRAVTHCNTLQLTATHCNTLQHTATYK